MLSPLEQTLNETAAEACKFFPQQLARLVVVAVPNAEMPVYVSPQVAEELTNGVSLIGRALKKLPGNKSPRLRDTLEYLTGTDRPSTMRKALRKLAREMHDAHATGISYRRYKLAGTSVSLIGMLNDNIMGLFSERYTKEMQAVFVLDHEIGHLILRNGNSPDAQKSENAANAYAMLRHIQRYGKNTDRAGYCAEKGALSIPLLSDTEHYTTDAVERAIAVANEKGDDFFQLSLFETAKLAEEIADACTLNDQVLKKLREAYLPVAQACAKHIGDPWQIIESMSGKDKVAHALVCREAIAVMRQHPHDPDIIKLGKQFFGFPPLKEFMTAAADKNNFWKDALDFITTHQPPENPAIIKGPKP